MCIEHVTKQYQDTSGPFTKIDHILGHKTNLNRFERTEIIQSILSDNNGFNNKSTSNREKNDLWVKEEFSKEIKKKYIER